MPHILVRHKVEDYPKWKAVFDEGAVIRKSGGEKSYQIFRLEGDPNNLVLLFEWDSLDSARKFLETDDLKDAMKKGGVSEQPHIQFLGELDKGAI